MATVHQVKGNYQQADNDDPYGQEDMRDRLSDFIGKLQTEAKRRVDRRINIEQRWLDDLRQYHGKYDAETVRKLAQNESSAVFLNLTRPKTNAMMARLGDLLFPTDDRNWAIGPTPVPEMAHQTEDALRLADDAEETFAAKEAELRQAEENEDEERAQALASEMEQAQSVATEARQAADELHEVLNEAKDRARLMQEEIDDQLKECQYQAACRDIIRDACKIGMGVLKGPVLGDKLKRRWQETQIEGGGSVYELKVIPDNSPSAHWVDPWGFFPDPDCKNVEDGESVFERHLMNRKQLRKFAKRDDVNQDAVRKLLKAGPDTGNNPSYLVDLNDLTEQKHSDVKDTYHVWEFTGILDLEEIKLLAEALGDEGIMEDMVDDIDPLDEIHAKVWFCQGEVLKFALHPLDSNEVIYSVFTLEEDENSPFGFGIPYIMRDPQSIVNGAQRMMMDNAGYSSGPQIVVNEQAVRPEDGKWGMKPHKIWKRNNKELANGARAFETFDIPSQQAELANIIQLGRQSVDEETSMPQIAQGEQGAGVTKTAGGMTLLMNSANVVFRRSVKNFDDHVTTPMLRRFYDWNMQFNPKEEIKGDYEVDARGSSVLLVREMIAQNLIIIAQMFGDHPVYGEWIKHSELMRAIFRAHMIPADEITKTEREYLTDQEEKNNAQPDPIVIAEQMKAAENEKDRELKREEMDLKREIANLEAEVKREIAELNYDGMMQKIAETLEINQQKLEAMIADSARKDDSAERRLATEVAMKERTGESAGGSI